MLGHLLTLLSPYASFIICLPRAMSYESFVGNNSCLPSLTPSLYFADRLESAHAQSMGWISVLLRDWHWYWLLLPALLWEIKTAYRMFLMYPGNIKVIGVSTVFGRWLTGLFYLLFAERMVSRAYIKGKGRPWAIPTRDKYHVCVASSKHIEEFSQASIHDVSLQGAVHELFPPHELYGGIPAGDLPGNLGLSQVIFKSSLRSHLPMLQPLLQRRIKEAFRDEVHGKKTADGWARVSLHYTTYRITARLNSLVIVGEEMSNDPKFVSALMCYLRNATIVEEAIRFVPGCLSFLKPVISTAILKSNNCMQDLSELLTKQVQDLVDNPKPAINKPMNCVQWSIDRSRKATVPALSRHVLAILFASTHQIPILIAFAFYRLCMHPEYVEPLRQEIQRYSRNYHNINNEDMPHLDSFLKEVVRLHPITVVSMPHKVLSPFTFSDGTHVPAGNWLCIPQREIMQDASYYEDPLSFQGFRFVDRTSRAGPISESRLSHPSWTFPFWGTVKQACPARFYVSMVAKMVLSHYLSCYDFKLADPKAQATLTWGIACVPHPALRILLRERNE